MCMYVQLAHRQSARTRRISMFFLRSRTAKVSSKDEKTNKEKFESPKLEYCTLSSHSLGSERSRGGANPKVQPKSQRS